MRSLNVAVTSSLEEAYAGFDLPACTGFVFQHPEWLRIWLETIGAARQVQPCFVRITSMEGVPLMVLPFGVHRQKGVRILGFLDAGVSDYNAPWFFPQWPILSLEEASALWALIQNKLPTHDVLWLQKCALLPETGPALWHALPHTAHPTQGHAAVLQSPWASYYAQRASKRAKQKSRRAIEQLEEFGPLRFEQVTSLDDHSVIFDALFAQKRRKLLETRGTDQMLSADFLAFYQKIVTQTSLGHLSALLSQDQPIATHAGAVWQKRFYYLIPAYTDGLLAKFSPGKIHMLKLMEWAADSGCQMFDLGIGDESYKEGWSDETRPLLGVSCARTLKGVFYLVLQKHIQRLKKVDRLRAIVRRLRHLRRSS
jgi:CelD/BcsL family acetyltransferase involved in cellulose biosynthesis